MTLAIGIARRGKVWIGADSASSGGVYTDAAREPKVWRAGQWIVAGAGLWRELNIGRLYARLPPPQADALERSAWAAAVELRRARAEQGWEPEEDSDPPEWLLATRGGLWCVQHWNVEAVTEAAIGSGWEFARGWLDASPLSDAELRIRECLKAAARRMPGSVRGPFSVLGA